MAKSTINTGTTANDGTGDTLRAAGVKINDNFSEIYNTLGDGTGITVTATPTELNYVDGVTSAIQTQLDAKAATSSLATVATSGAYSDLSGSPSIPAALTDLGISDGTTGQVLSTNGSGTFTFVDDQNTEYTAGSGLQLIAGAFSIDTTADVSFNSVSSTTVLTLTPLAAAPGSPASGMFAVADGTTWDPATKSGSVPYPVFYDGTIWNALY